MRIERDRVPHRRRITVTVGAILIVGACTGSPAAQMSAPPQGGDATLPSALAPTSASTASDRAPSESVGVPDRPPSTAEPDAEDYRGQGSSRTLTYSVAKCDGPTGGSWNVDIRESSGGGAFVFFEIPDGSDHAPAQIEYEILLGDPANLEGTGTFVAGDPPHFVIENGEGRTDLELEVGSFCH